MRRPLVAGNWKMNKNYSAGKELLEALIKSANKWSDRVEVMVAPPAPFLADFALHSIERIAIGAQNVSSHADFGAYTGEYCATMLRSAGVRYAIIAHSERRMYHGENDQSAASQIRACTEAEINPVYCCGENLAQREAENHIGVVAGQVETALRDFDAQELKDLVVAYEPVWAIGTGKTASAAQAQEMHAKIRSVLKDLFGGDFAQATRILYGGSCKPDNAEEIFAQPDVDGGLIGGAALKAEDFAAIIRAAE